MSKWKPVGAQDVTYTCDGPRSRYRAKRNELLELAAAGVSVEALAEVALEPETGGDLLSMVEVEEVAAADAEMVATGCEDEVAESKGIYAVVGADLDCGLGLVEDDTAGSVG
jgi:hypothetical protein